MTCVFKHIILSFLLCFPCSSAPCSLDRFFLRLLRRALNHWQIRKCWPATVRTTNNERTVDWWILMEGREMDWLERVCLLYYCYTHASCSTKHLLTPEPLFLHLHRPVQVFVWSIYFFFTCAKICKDCAVQSRMVTLSVFKLYTELECEWRSWKYGIMWNWTLSTSCIFFFQSVCNQDATKHSSSNKIKETYFSKVCKHYVFIYMSKSSSRTKI